MHQCDCRTLNVKLWSNNFLRRNMDNVLKVLRSARWATSAFSPVALEVWDKTADLTVKSHIVLCGESMCLCRDPSQNKSTEGIHILWLYVPKVLSSPNSIKRQKQADMSSRWQRVKPNVWDFGLESFFLNLEKSAQLWRWIKLNQDSCEDRSSLAQTLSFPRWNEARHYGVMQKV